MIKIRRPLVSREFKELKKIGFLKKAGRKFILNPDFIFLEELKSLVTKTSPGFRQEVKKMILKISPARFLVFSGIFFGDLEVEVDILAVAEKFNPKKLEKLAAKLAKNLGRPINYSVMNRKEFEYRWRMFDRFLRDIFEGPYEILINKIGFEGT